MDRRWARALTTTTLHGRPVAVTGTWNDTTRVHDLTTHRPAGTPLAGRHRKPVERIAAATINNRPVAITSANRMARLWDLTTGQRIRPDMVFPAPVTAVTLSPHGHIIVCYGRDIAVLTNKATPAKGNQPGR